MKKTFRATILILIAAIFMSLAIPVSAEELPREAAPVNAPEEAIVIAENLINGILDEATAGLGYADAKNKANNAIFNAVIAGQTNGYGYGILSAISCNAIFEYRDLYLRPEYYAAAEETVKSLISDLIVDVQNGKDYNEARKEAYIRILQSVNLAFNPTDCYMTDFCYWDIPAVDSAMFNRARKLLLEAQSARIAP